MIVRKSAAEIEIMREAGRVSARALRLVGEAVAPGVTTAELDELAEAVIREARRRARVQGLPRVPQDDLHLAQLRRSSTASPAS